MRDIDPKEAPQQLGSVVKPAPPPAPAMAPTWTPIASQPGYAKSSDGSVRKIGAAWPFQADASFPC